MKSINKSKKNNSTSLLEDQQLINDDSSNEFSNSFVSKNFSTTISPKDTFKTIPSNFPSILNDLKTSKRRAKNKLNEDIYPPPVKNADVINMMSEYMELNNVLKSSTYKEKIFDASCIRKRTNIANYTRNHFDNNIDSKKLYEDRLNSFLDYNYVSPKVEALINKIKELDEMDMKEHGTYYKHFIFTNLKTKNYGINVLSNELMKHGWKLGFYGIPVESLLPNNIEQEEINKDANPNAKPLLSVNKMYKVTGPNAKKNEKNRLFNGLHFLTDEELLENKFYNFYVMSSQALFEKTFDRKVKTEILSRYNARPGNVYGEKIRIIITDNGFKEGIDIFDIKYIHIFEPPDTLTDLKQAIGRGTRTCGQSGLPFDPKRGWLLHVYIYDIIMPKVLSSLLKESKTTFDLFTKAKNVNIATYNLIATLENTLIENAVDNELTMTLKEINEKNSSDSNKLSSSSVNSVLDSKNNKLAINDGDSSDKSGMKKERYEVPKEKMGHKEMRDYILKEFKDFKWKTPKVENECVKLSNSRMFDLSMTQKFISTYFTPETYNKGMLLWHTVGSGKCHSLNTPILMYDGSIKMVQDVKVGDLLMGDDSTPREVLSLASGVDEMYDICYDNGDKYGVNREHILVLKMEEGMDEFERKYDIKEYKDKIRYIGGELLIEIEVNEYLKLPFSFRNKLKGIRTKVSFNLSSDLSLLTERHKNIEINPYMYGIWLMGKDITYASNNVYQNTLDYEFKINHNNNKNKNVIKYLQKIVNNKSKTDKDVFSIHEDSFGDYTYISKKNTFLLSYLSSSFTSKNLHISNNYKINDYNARLRLLAGIIDMYYMHYINNEKKQNVARIIPISSFADGNKKISISIISKSLANDVIFLCRSLGYHIELYPISIGIYNNLNKYIIDIYGTNLEEIPSKIFTKYELINYNSPYDVLTHNINVINKGKDNYYGFTISGNGRYILGDFTITHNTCTAVATASKAFEENNYTILWVTKTTLKDDIWKNIYDRTCHMSLRKVLAISDDKEIKFNKKSLSKSWAINPISYKQFTNLIEKKNKIYDRLIKINGVEDPLRKTLIIIDEAHKLYGNTDLSTLEKPNMEKFHNALMNSYRTNGTKSAKVLLMTATPIKDDPMEIIQLINLLKMPDEQIPDTLEEFKDKYLTNELEFTERGREEFCDETAGLISYLNLSTVIGKFAQPIIHPIYISSIKDEEILNIDINFTKQVYNKLMLENKINMESLMFEKSNIPRFSGKLNELKQYYCQDKVAAERKECSKIIKYYIDDMKDKIKNRKDKINQEIALIKNENKSITEKRQRHVNIIKERLRILPRNIRDIPKELPTLENIMKIENPKLKKQLLLMRKFYDNPLYAIYKKCVSKPDITDDILYYYKNNMEMNDEDLLKLENEMKKLEKELLEERKHYTKSKKRMSKTQKELYQTKINNKADVLKEKKKTYKLKLKAIKKIVKPVMKEKMKTLKNNIKEKITDIMINNNINNLERDLKNISVICPDGKVYNPQTGRCVKMKETSNFKRIYNGGRKRINFTRKRI